MASPMSTSPWPHLMSLVDARRGTAGHPTSRHLEASPSERAHIAEALGLKSLEALQTELRLSAWRDGARVEGAWCARVTQICGVTLDPFETNLAGEFAITVVPEGSVLAEPPTGPEIVVDPDAEDPPDVLVGDQIDLGGYVVEHLALEIDPFPRKPGVVFEATHEVPPPSPFAALGGLKAGRPNGKA